MLSSDEVSDYPFDHDAFSNSIGLDEVEEELEVDTRKEDKVGHKN